jgi:transposase-like protein
MSVNRRKCGDAFKKNVVKLSYVSSKTIKAPAKDLKVSENMLHRRRQRYTQSATLEEALKAI